MFVTVAVEDDYVLGNGRLTDVHAKFQQFAVNARSAPPRICRRHVSNQRPDVRRNRWSAEPAMTLPAPERPKAATVPGDDGLRPDNDQRPAPLVPHRDNQTQSQRSPRVSRSRRGCDRCSTCNW